MKNYISFVNDHSGSMLGLAQAACKDFNANIAAIKDAASAEMLDTVVSVSEVGYNMGLSVTVSNPHVLKPLTEWKASGGTPLWDGINALLKMLLALPDINKPQVSMLVMITTDGEATRSMICLDELAAIMRPLIATGRWTFVARVPAGISSRHKADLVKLGIQAGNIQTWETTEAGMAASTVQTAQAMGDYFRGRSAGSRATSAFYTDASKVNVAALEDISKKVSLYVVPREPNGIEIRDFILSKRMVYLKGAAFYQLTKTEARVSHTKQVLVRDQATGKVFGGKQARDMIGLPSDRNARLHPGDHKAFDLFIQSESINRKLVGGTGVLYWPEVGTAFTEADLAYLNPKHIAAPAVVQLAKVPVSVTPTKSPLIPTKRVCHFETREEARRHCAAKGVPQSSIQKNLGSLVRKEHRWYV